MSVTITRVIIQFSDETEQVILAPIAPAVQGTSLEDLIPADESATEEPTTPTEIEPTGDPTAPEVDPSAPVETQDTTVEPLPETTTE